MKKYIYVCSKGFNDFRAYRFKNLLAHIKGRVAICTKIKNVKVTGNNNKDCMLLDISDYKDLIK